MLFGLQEVKPTDGGVADHAYRRAITLRLGTVDNLVVSVTTDGDSDLAMHARSDGRDIVFTDGDGTPLDFELVAYSAGTLDAWVMIPNVTAPVTTIYLYYGGPMTVPTAPPWTMAEHGGVWHFAGQTATELDSSMYGHNLTALANEVPSSTKGIVGDARVYDGSDDTMCGAGGTSLNQGMGSFGVAAWVYITASVGQFDQALFKGGNTSGVPGYSLELGTSAWAANVADNDTTHVTSGFTSETLNAWVYLAFFVDRNDALNDADDVILGYVNGALVDSAPLPGLGSVDGPSPICLGGPDNNPFHGILDEVRVYKRPLDPRKVAAEYANLAQREATIQIGDEENSL